MTLSFTETLSFKVIRLYLYITTNCTERKEKHQRCLGMGRFDKRFSVTGRRNQVCDFSLINCFLRNISRYPTIIFFFLADCFKFYKTRLIVVIGKF